MLWLEAAHDVGEGASKANSAITASGYDTTPGTLEADLVRASSPRWEELCAELDVPFSRIGALALAFDEAEETEALPHLLERAGANGVDAEIVDGDDARELAPAVAPAARAALHVPAEGIIDPLRLVCAYAEAAVGAGVELRRATPAIGFRKSGDGPIREVETPAGRFAVGHVVNAAGLWADLVSEAAGAEGFRMWPRKGQFLLVDREIGQRVTKIVTPIPSERTRGVLAIPTTNGSLLLGPTAEDGEDREDKSTDRETLEHVFAQATRLLQGVERRHVIKAFAGLRPASERTYRVERSERVPNLVHAAAIRSTGVSASPAVADLVRALLAEGGQEEQVRRARPPARRLARLAELPAAEVALLTSRDAAYGVVVCACEHVSAAEIRHALAGPVPALSIDGVRKRTRASAGRCQGAYCSAGIGFLLSLAHGLEPWQVPQGEPGTAWGVGEA